MSNDHDDRDARLTRRRFIRGSAMGIGGGVLSPFIINLAACQPQSTPPPGPAQADGAPPDMGTPPDAPRADKKRPPDKGAQKDKGVKKDKPVVKPDKGNPNVLGPDDVLLGLYPSATVKSSKEAVRQACKHLDFSWLSKGDSVFVKLSVNSGNLHPAVTSPEAVRGMVAELYKRGAGKVIVGDQAGVEHVRHVSSGKRFSSTSKLLVQDGLQKAINDADAQAHLFDDQDYHKGWFPAKPPAGSAWKAIFLPKIIKQVDHIVYLPRLSSHAIAGNTIGHKIAVGVAAGRRPQHLPHPRPQLLRDVHRRQLHQGDQGPAALDSDPGRQGAAGLRPGPGDGLHGRSAHRHRLEAAGAPRRSDRGIPGPHG